MISIYDLNHNFKSKKILLILILGPWLANNYRLVSLLLVICIQNIFNIYNIFIK